MRAGLRVYARLAFVTAALGLGVVMCGGSSNEQACVPGQSIACSGVGGCSGYQLCNSLGSYDPCDCAGADGSASPDAANDVSVDDATVDTNVDTNVDDATPDGPPDGPPDDATVVDAPSTDAALDAFVDAGNWTPLNLTGLVLWLDDTVGIVQDPQKPGYVRRWPDQSGKGNNADVANYQTGEPTIDPSALNGLDVIAYGYGAQCFLPPWSTDFEFGTGDFLVAGVVKLATPSQAPGHFLWNESSTGVSVYQDGSNNVTLLAGGNEAVVHNPDISKFHIVIATGAALTLRVDAQSATGLTNTTNLTSTGGCIMSITSTLTGSTAIAEALIVKGTVSPGDVTNLQNYWKKKFNL